MSSRQGWGPHEGGEVRHGGRGHRMGTYYTREKNAASILVPVGEPPEIWEHAYLGGVNIHLLVEKNPTNSLPTTQWKQK